MGPTQPLETTGRLPARPASIDELASRAIEYGRSARAKSTERAYRFDWIDFEGWCASHHLSPLPASPSTVGLYLTDRAATLAVATLRRRVAAISVAHQLAGEHLDRRNPAIAEVFKGIARAHGTRQHKKRALTWPQLKLVLRKIPDDLAGSRDRAILLVMFWGALRRSELVAIDLEHLQLVAQGFVLTIPRSKTDQAGEGEQLAIPRLRNLCPVAALQAWTHAGGVSSGPVFRSIRFGHHTIGDRLNDRSIARIVKAAVSRIGLDDAEFSGHSLRRGFLTSAAEGGADLTWIMKHSRHRDVRTAQGYVEAGQMFNNPALKAAHRR